MNFSTSGASTYNATRLDVKLLLGMAAAMKDTTTEVEETEDDPATVEEMATQPLLMQSLHQLLELRIKCEIPKWIPTRLLCRNQCGCM